METRKEIRELHRMACPIICHYVLTSLFEMFDQAIIGQNSTRGFALVGIASVVLYGVTGALGMLFVFPERLSFSSILSFDLIRLWMVWTGPLSVWFPYRL